MKICHYCNKCLPDSADHCYYCGNKFLSNEEIRFMKNNQRICVKCGKVIDLSSLSCPYCNQEYELHEQKQVNPKSRWEYKRIQTDATKIKSLDLEMQMLGLEGWELVSSFFTMTHPSFSLDANTYVHMIFKRELEAQK